MKKIVFIIILKIGLLPFGYAQNRVVNKFVIPQKTGISLLKTATNKLPACSLTAFSLQEPKAATVLHFNNQPVLKAAVTKTVSFFTTFSFSDVFENSMNSLKADLINTYDDHITELFKDAPSLIKMSCIIPF